MNELPEPMRSILGDYCHVEWYEIDELADDVKNESGKFDIAELKKQFRSMIATDANIVQQVNSLTSNDFESMAEVKVWLNNIYRAVFK